MWHWVTAYWTCKVLRVVFIIKILCLLLTNRLSPLKLHQDFFKNANNTTIIGLWFWFVDVSDSSSWRHLHVQCWKWQIANMSKKCTFINTLHVKVKDKEWMAPWNTHVCIYNALCNRIKTSYRNDHSWTYREKMSLLSLLSIKLRHSTSGSILIVLSDLMMWFHWCLENWDFFVSYKL